MTRRRLLLGAAAVLALANLVPLSRSNPPVEQEVDAPPGARAVLERSCFDCHSNQTRWPWYAWVAPASWLLSHDVNEARGHMNFSTWNRYDAQERAEHLEEIAEVVEEGEMPPWFYLPLHPKARLSQSDAAAIHAWTGEAPPTDGARSHHHREHER